MHLSVAKSLTAAAERAHALRLDALQIFTSSPRMWKAPPIRTGEASRFAAARARYGLHPLVIHDSYLINLAAASGAVRRQSIVAYRGEVERALALGADYLVAHPGSGKDQTTDEAIARFAAAIEEAAAGLQPAGLTLLLECTAGQGKTLGARLEELAALREAAAHRVPFPIGYCLDTCHLFAAGYDITTEEGLAATLAEADRWLRLDRIPVWHTNDSKGTLGSRLDRHEQIGKGLLGTKTFERLLRHPKLAGKTCILETPVVEEGDDVRNVRRLRRAGAIRSRAPATPRSDSA